MPNNFVKICSCLTVLVAHLILSTGLTAQPWAAAKPLNEYAGKDDWQDTKPQVASNGSGITMAAWVNPGGLAITRSTNNGSSWTQVYGNSNFTLPQALVAEVAYAGNNTWTALWIATTTTADKQILVTRSTDNGLNWSAPQQLSVGPANDDLDMESDENGTIIAVSPRFTIRSGDYGATWQVVELGVYTENPVVLDRVAYNGAGKWFHVQGGLSGGFDIFYLLSVRTSTDGGQTWTSFQNLDGRFTLTGFFEVMGGVAARGDTAVIALRRPGQNYAGEALSVVVSQDNGANWSDYTYVGNVDPYGQIDIDVDSQRWVITAKATGSNTLNSYVATDNPLAWEAIGQVNNNIPESNFASVAALDNGGFISGFQVNRNNEPKSLGADLDLQSAYLPAAQTSWTVQSFINPTADLDIPRLEDHGVDIELAPDGSAVAVWVATNSFSESEVFFALSNDFGLTWTNGAPINQQGFHLDHGGFLFRPRVLYVNPESWFVYWDHGSQNGKCTWSTDNGFTWAPPADFNASFAGSNRKGMLLKAQPRWPQPTAISRSVDGGSTWEEIATFADALVNHMVHTGGTSWFIGGRIGFSFGATGFTMVSHDDGNTWEKVLNITGLSIGDMEDITSSRDGTAVAVDSHIRRANSNYYDVVYSWTTHDHGRTWEYRDLYAAVYGGPTDDATKATVAWPGANTWIVFWNKLAKVNGQLAPLNERIWFSISNNDGNEWSAPSALKPETPPAAGQRFPNIAAQNGNVIIAWQTYLDPTVENTQFGYDPDLLYSTNKLPGFTTAARDWNLYD